MPSDTDPTSPPPREPVLEPASLRSDLFDSVCREVDGLPREVLSRYHVLLETPYDERTQRDVTVLSRTD